MADEITAAYKAWQKDPKQAKEPQYAESFFKAFTIQQLDTLSKLLTKKGCDIAELNTQYVSSYFAKIYSNELSKENQDHMDDGEKLANLVCLYKAAKQRKLPKSLASSLLYEILLLTVKLEDYKEDYFKEYLEQPLERNSQLKRAPAKASAE